MPYIKVKNKFAWKPVLTTSGKWLWWCRYVKRSTHYYGPAGESAVSFNSEDEYFTENEWLIELVKKNDKQNLSSKADSAFYHCPYIPDIKSKGP